MKNERYIDRIIDKKIEKYLKNFGAISIEGPKWCGKTWSGLQHANSFLLIGDPTRSHYNKTIAEMDTAGVLVGDTPRLIDEWQEVPALWDAVRFEVDMRGEKGQFIFTGSSTPNRDGIIHSGAGRFGIIRMRTMSLYESGDSSGQVSLYDVCNNSLKGCISKDITLNDLAYYIVRGGWPGNINTSVEDAGLLPKEYLNLIIHNDINNLDTKKYDMHKMLCLLKSLARNESTTASRNKLLRDIKDFELEDIDSRTVATYLNVFERLYLIENQPPYSTKVRSSTRIKNSEKLHFCDPALACALLDLNPEKLVNDLETFGFLFEALVERDLRIYADAFGGKLYHYQDYNNDEIDAVVELPDGSWTAFEIKLGGNQIDKAAENLLRIKDKFDDKEKPKNLVVIVGLYNAAYTRDDGVMVVPINALKD